MISDLRQEVETFYDHYLYLRDIMAVSKHMGDSSNLAKEKSPNFFRIVESACIDAMMMEFARLYDDDKSAKTIPSLLDKCMNNVTLFTNKKKIENNINEYKRKIKDDDYIPKAISTIKLRRDKIFAHNDRKFFVNPEKDNSYLPTYQLWFLRDFTGEVIHFLMDELESKVTKTTIYDKDLDELCKFDIFPQTSKLKKYLSTYSQEPRNEKYKKIQFSSTQLGL